MHVHVEHARLVPHEVIVQRSHIHAVLEQRRHYRIDLVLRQHEITHHDVHAAGAFRHRHPSTKAEWRRRLDVGHGDADIVPRNVDFQHIGFVVARLAEGGEHLLVLGGNVLRPRSGRERQ